MAVVHCACWANFPSLFFLSKIFGTRTDEVNGGGNLPVQLAVVGNNATILEELLDQNMDVLNI